MDTYTQRGMPTGAEEVSASRMMEESAPIAAPGPAPVVTITQQDGRFMVEVRGGAQPQNFQFASLEEAAPVVAEAFGLGAPAGESAMAGASPMMGRA